MPRVEDSDAVIIAGTLMNDFNTGAYTSNLDPARIIDIRHHHVRVGGMTYQSVEMNDLLRTLAVQLPRNPLSAPDAGSDAPITAAHLYPRWERFLKPDNILVAETGTVSMGMAFTRLPQGATFQNQTLWGSIGWATPAAVGAALAAKDDRRVVLITGEGSHQVMVQEIGQFGRLGLRPVVFILSKNGYLIEHLLCAHPDIPCNDVPLWRYTDLPEAPGL
ncbi:thiamine pyrophosphate-dependent enzyme [Streptomyces griseoluteus]|uniref:thiamine pyrophosphate-dependent enzyme n=1 Tax=Streptomyces griseoluteus TaxID=29306 RepID=UPI003683EB36